MNLKIAALLLFILLFSGCRSSVAPDPSTIIHFSVEQSCQAKMELENNYNTVISILYDGYCKPGIIYRITVDALNLPEGLYFVTLECKGINSNYYKKTTSKIVLIK